jgi:hypothetical protein
MLSKVGLDGAGSSKGDAAVAASSGAKWLALRITIRASGQKDVCKTVERRGMQRRRRHEMLCVMSRLCLVAADIIS